MANYTLLSINSVDYTKYVRTQEYSVLKADVMETWTDANHITHGHVLRTRLTGSIHLEMPKTIYDAFLANLAAVKNSDGTHTILVHPNTDTTGTTIVSANVFIELSVRVVYGTVNYSYKPYGMDIQIEFEEA